jgi:gluconolactonase
MANDPDATKFTVQDPVFLDILGPNPSLETLLENHQYPFAHEAGVFIAAENELFITSNLLANAEGKSSVQISKVRPGPGSSPTTCEEIHCPNIKMANGGVNYKDDSQVLFCAQGSLDSPSGLYLMSTSPPYTSQLLLSDFYGRPFNSVNDVVVHGDSSIWFTDPIYGYEQGYRPRPALPNQVYRFDPVTRNVRAMADGFGRPNGICFNPDESVVYITDTDWIHGDGGTDGMRVSSMYVYSNFPSFGRCMERSVA